MPQPSFLMFYIVSLAMTFAFLLTRVQILLWPGSDSPLAGQLLSILSENVPDLAWPPGPL